MSNLPMTLFFVTLILLLFYRVRIFSKIFSLFQKNVDFDQTLEKHQTASSKFSWSGTLFKSNAPQKKLWSQMSHTLTVIVTVIITFALLGASLYVILSQHFGESEQKWAFGTVGTVVGYWLKPPVS